MLIGGPGHDVLRGGAGNDIYIVNDGDVVQDADRNGQIFWDGRQLTGGTRQGDEPEGVFRSADGQTTYRIQGADLLIGNERGQSVTVQDFQSGSLGIELGQAHVQREHGASQTEQGAVKISESGRYQLASLSQDPPIAKPRMQFAALSKASVESTTTTAPALRQAVHILQRERAVANRSCRTEREHKIRATRRERLCGGRRVERPAHKMAHMKTSDAIAQPVEQSLAQLQALGETQRQQQSQQQEQQREQLIAPQHRMV